MSIFTPIRPLRVSNEVTEQLKQSILLGHFKPGDKLPSERELAEEFQVSRVAIREALRALENAGFVITRQGTTGGAFVTDLSFEQLANSFLDLFLCEKLSIPELYHVRRLIEPEVARLAALRVNDEYARRLREALEAERTPGPTLSEEVDRKTTVHYILAEMCGNRFFEALVTCVMRLTKQVVEVVRPDTQKLHPAGLHDAAVEAVLAGDPETAAREMEKHATAFGKNLMKMEEEYHKTVTQ
ncbi:MAG: FadR/GntR family transcriptional regulator [Syntrophorhabdaceae bacterium]|nr:FadR/GntR family transcriptional regulator [Syntrophorhabdaceae bacterium]